MGYKFDMQPFASTKSRTSHATPKCPREHHGDVPLVNTGRSRLKETGNWRNNEICINCCDLFQIVWAFSNDMVDTWKALLTRTESFERFPGLAKSSLNGQQRVKVKMKDV